MNGIRQGNREGRCPSGYRHGDLPGGGAVGGRRGGEGVRRKRAMEDDRRVRNRGASRGSGRLGFVAKDLRPKLVIPCRIIELV